MTLSVDTEGTILDKSGLSEISTFLAREGPNSCSLKANRDSECFSNLAENRYELLSFFFL